ncbi:MAG: efflux RND transporter periplasmic adaptor subunit [Alphaproteobacteria bacterium]|nr:efflux RND transporter periplasmic adaptor subunit [Alphaproteobacteria bacterium]
MSDTTLQMGSTVGDIERTLGVGRARSPLWRRWWVILIAVTVVAAAAWWFLTPAKKLEYVKAKAEVATIRALVTATGTLQPIDKVTVGAEVSGKVDELLVDFNSIVKKGDIIARINTDELRARAVQARASVAQAQANLAKTENDMKRAIALRDKGFASQSVFDSALAARDAAAATLNSTKAQSDQTEANLAKAVIRSPIDGIVLDRKVERGQTVTAGFQTPEMFVIASDLARLELTVDIDEADIGEVALNQDATFTVDAFPAQIFDAKVAELRNAAKTVSNVVTYQGVLQVDNSKRLLKPGMTATTDIVVKVATNVMTVPNGALRFSPQTQADTTLVPQSTTAPVDPIAAGKGEVWNLGADGKPVSRKVTLGVTDGRRTQVTSTNVKAGEEFILDIAQPGRAAQ